jgi:threonyl-tRNA synthetase
MYPKGTHIYNKLMDLIKEQYRCRGYHEVISPNLFSLKLWKTSGHYEKYKENMFIMGVENAGFGAKPMNCPAHCLMFMNEQRNYRQLPFRIADFGVLHRNELSGALTGLTRVRRFCQDDGHIFCTEDQIMQEVMDTLDFLDHIYGQFKFRFELELSTRPEHRLGSDDLWDKAEAALEAALNKYGLPWKRNPGDGAFYGPKIDIGVYDALNRTH